MEEERKRLCKRRMEKQIDTVHCAVLANTRRIGLIKDPVARNLIPVYLISTLTDIATTTLRSEMTYNDYEISDEYEMKLKEISEIVSKLLDSLVEWIQSPIYSPDHPVGNALMQKAGERFSESSLVAKIEQLEKENKELKEKLNQ